MYGLKINQQIPTEDLGFMGGLPNPDIPDRNNHGMNILLGLIQLGIPLDQALQIALEQQGPDPNGNDPQFKHLTMTGATGGDTGDPPLYYPGTPVPAP